MSIDHVDDVGIIRRTDRDEPWLEVPDAVAQTARRARTADEVITTMLDGPQPWPVPLQRELLHPSTGAVATLVPASCRTALDLGTGWFGLAPALAALGVTVTRADWVYPRLRFARLMHPTAGGTDLHVGLGDLPPPGSGPFDAVFLDLDALARRGVGTAAVTSLLTAVRRLLTPRGAVIVGAANHRMSLLRDGRLLRALSASSFPARARRSGLVIHEVLVPLPDRASWRVLVPRTRLRHYLRVHDQRTGVKRVVGRLLLNAAGERLLAPDSYLVLTPSGNETVHTLRDQLVGEPAHTGPLTMALSDARVALVGSEQFVKVALSEDQRRALRAEADKTRRAGRTAFAPVVLEPGKVDETAGILSVTYPAVAARTVAPTTARDVISGALERLDASQSAPLTDTSLWSRLTSARGQRDLDELGAQALWHWLADKSIDCVVPVGPTHGDLHPDNVLVSLSGDAVLVDWNRFEENNPLVLDPLYAAVNLEQVMTGCSLTEALQRAAADSLTGKLARRAHRVRGDLDALQSAALLLLDRLVSYSLPRRRYKPWTLPPFEQAVRALTAAVTERTSHDTNGRVR